MARIAFLGTGAMGARMAMNLLKNNHEVTVWNRTADKTDGLRDSGASIADSPREAVAAAEIAISMVRDDRAAHQIWLDAQTGALGGLTENAVVVECSTVTPAWARELAQHCAARSLHFLDAPVAGSRPQAEAAQLIFIVGGAPDALAQVEPILKTMGASIFHVGAAAGSGATVKLAVNTLFGIQVAALGEIVGFLKKSGVDVNQAIEMIAASPVCSPAAKAAAGAMLAGNFAPQFPIELVEKDFGYVHETAVASQASVPLADAARQVFQTAIAAGQAEENLTGVVKLYDE